MSVIGYFGVPGCGKTTTLVMLSRRLKKKYDNIYSVNVEIKGIPQITKEDCRKYKFTNSLILWDEITLDYDNRDYNRFTKEDKEFWLLHRHTGSDIIYATQNYENVDKKIRDITDTLWYMTKSAAPLLKGITKSKRIYRTISINENTSDLVVGYRFCNFIESLFLSNNKICIRKFYYKYFNTNELLGLAEREEYNDRKEENNNNNNNNGIVLATIKC